MNKGCGVLGLIMALTGLVVALALNDHSLLDRPRAAQERRFAEDRHAVEMRALEEQADLNSQQARQLAPVKTAALGMGMMSLAFMAMGGSFYIVLEMRKRSCLIQPNRMGLYPVVRISLPNGVVIMHDPNRMPTATIAYSVSPDGQQARMDPLTLPGLKESVQQAAGVQMTVASMHRGPRPTVSEAMNIVSRLRAQQK